MAFNNSLSGQCAGGAGWEGSYGAGESCNCHMELSWDMLGAGVRADVARTGEV